MSKSGKTLLWVLGIALACSFVKSQAAAQEAWQCVSFEERERLAAEHNFAEMHRVEDRVLWWRDDDELMIITDSIDGMSCITKSGLLDGATLGYVLTELDKAEEPTL